MIEKIRKILLENGYTNEMINGREVFYKGQEYLRIDYVKCWNQFVVESANSKQEALNNVFEDSDFISENADEEEIIEVLKRCIE